MDDNLESEITIENLYGINETFTAFINYLADAAKRDGFADDSGWRTENAIRKGASRRVKRPVPVFVIRALLQEALAKGYVERSVREFPFSPTPITMYRQVLVDDDNDI